MKVYISADIEGVCGIACWDEARRDHPDYPRFQARMQREVRAACEGALAAGAREVVVKDAHASGRNLDGADLPAGVRLVSGWSGHPLAMVQELDASFDALALVGYHAGARSGGNVLAHTFSSSRVTSMRLNDQPASEFLLHAHAAEALGVPTVFVSGDEELCAEVSAAAPKTRTVASMRGVGRSVVARHPAEVEDAIRAELEAALRGDLQAARLARPERYRLEVRYATPADAYRASFYPGAEALDGDGVAFASADMLEVMRMILFTVRAL